MKAPQSPPRGHAFWAGRKNPIHFRHAGSLLTLALTLLLPAPARAQARPVPGEGGPKAGVRRPASEGKADCESFQALSENGRYLALTSHYYYEVKDCPHVVVWDTEKKKRLVVIEGKDHSIGMKVYKVFNDGRALVSDGRRVFLFDAKTKETLWSLKLSRRVLSADISDDGQFLTTSSFWEHPIKWFNLVKFWEIDKANRVSFLANMDISTYGVLKVEFFRLGGKLRALVCEGTGARCWVVDPRTGSVKKKIRIDWNPMDGHAFMPSGEGVLFSHSQHGKEKKGLCYVDFEKGPERFLGGHLGITTDCCILRVKEKTYFASADEKGFVCIWEGKNFLPKWWLQEKREEEKWEIWSVHLSVVHGNGRKDLVVATDWVVKNHGNSDPIDSSVELSWWDLEKKKCVRRARVGTAWKEIAPTGKWKPVGSKPGFDSIPAKSVK